jgi:hypothetical protein
MSTDPLRDLAAAATQRSTQAVAYQTSPSSTPAPAPSPAKGLFRVGFFFGLGFFTAGLVFWTVMFVGSLVLGGLLASACSASSRNAPPPAPWNFGR